MHIAYTYGKPTLPTSLLGNAINNTDQRSLSINAEMNPRTAKKMK